MNCLKREDQRQILKLMCRHSGINDIVDFTGHSPNTIRRQLARFGEGLASAHDRLIRNVKASRIEVDEHWAFVYAKRDRNLSRGPRKRQPPLDRGSYYTWVGLDPDTRLLISQYTGDRGFSTGLTFFVDLRSRVVGRPLISSDAHVTYPDAIQRSFGADMDHVVMHKEFKGWFDKKTGEKANYLVGLRKEAQNQSKVDVSLASTSLVERYNASVRNFNSRFTRQSYRFSKKLENHLHSQSVFAMYYNFVKAHRGFKGAERHYTPAMKAGLTDRVWTYDDLLDDVDEYWRGKAISADLKVVPSSPYTPLVPGAWSDRPYFVSFSPKKHVAKVHTATCRDSRRAGAGRKEGPRANLWYAFETEGGARRCAQTLAPLEHSVCSICIVGHYEGNMVTGRGPDGHRTIG